MKRKRHILLVMVLAAVLLTVLAFTVYAYIHKAQAKEVSVLLIHSYDKNLHSYKVFRDHLEREFEEKNINADIRYEYLSLSDQTRSAQDDLMDIQKRMDDDEWTPEIIVAEGDAAFQALRKDSLTIHTFLDVPVIATSIKFPEDTGNSHHSNVILFEDTIDYRRNIDLAYEITGNKEIEIELDHYHQDSLIREGLSKVFDDKRYYNFTFDSIEGLTDQQVKEKVGNKISILTLSIADPRNIGTFTDSIPTDGDYTKNVLTNIFIHTNEHPILVVKYDLYSHILASKSGRAQFTAVKESFANGTSRFLCGYFASFHTISQDIVSTIDAILDGQHLGGEVFSHRKDYYMDYKAMTQLGLEYKDYEKRFMILGAPFSVSNATLYYVLIIFISVIVVAALVTLGLYIFELRKRHSSNLRSQLKNEKRVTDLILQGSEVKMINDLKDIEGILARLDPSWDNVAGEIRKAYNENGIFSFRIFVPLYDDNISEWWQLHFAIEHDEEDIATVCGLMRNINQLVETEKEIERAHKKAIDANDKHELIMDMTEAIYKPLGLIISSCDLLAEETDQPLSAEEKKSLGKIINESNSELMDIINDILNFSRLESRKTEYLLSIHNAKDICEQIYSEWVDKMPPGVKLLRNYGRDDATVYCDGTHTHEVLRQFMSNAVKFTKHDTISIGYKSHLGACKTQIFVEDCGCGIPEDKLELIFNAFYKGDKFISGVGLGLNIASNLVHGMGGEMRVSSEEGIGSKFSVRFKSIEDES